MSKEEKITTRATSGTIVNNFRTGYKVQISWSVNSQNVANNTSNVTVKAQLVSTGSYYTISSSATKNGSLTINGTTYNFTFSAGLSANQTKTVFTKTVDIPHNSDGSKTFSMSTTLGINVTLSGTYWGSVSANGNGTLNPIPRTSSISLSTGSLYFGNTITVNINRASNNFTHHVHYVFGGRTVTFSTSATTSASYTIPYDHMHEIPHSTSGTATIYVDTYHGSTYIGTTGQSFTIHVPSDVKPSLSSLSASLVANGINSSLGYVKGKSSCTLTANGASGAYGSYITSYSISGGGYSSGSQSFTTGILNNHGSITFTASVVDSRGRRSDNKTVTINVNDYFQPQIHYPVVVRSNSNGISDNEGTYIHVSFEYSTAPVTTNVSNKVEYKATSSTSWINAGSITSQRGITFGANGISTSSSYDVRITVADGISSISQIFNVPTSFVTIDIKKGGKGIALGKVAETDNVFEVAMETKLSGASNCATGQNNTATTKVTDLNTIWKSGFYDIDGGLNMPFGGWNWVIHSGHTNNRDGYRYGMQIAGQNESNNFAMRTVNVHGVGNWCSLYHTGKTIDLPNNGTSWINGSYWGNIRGSKQSTGAFHPIITQTTSSNHRIAFGGLGDDFGFYAYKSSRTDNNFDHSFRFNLGNDRIYCSFSPQFENHVRIIGSNAYYFETYGGGWHMTDSTWIRTYNGKAIYSGWGEIRTEGDMRCRYLNSPSGQNLDLQFHSGTGYLNPYTSSGAGIIIGRPWSGSSGTEPCLYNNKGNGWGYLGNSGTTFYRVYGAGGSVSQRERKYEITKADTETQYENVKSINIYNYRTISTSDTTPEKLAKNHLTHESFKEENGELTTKKVILDGIEYDELDNSLTQDEIRELRIKEIVKKNPNFGEKKREDLMLGTMVDELPLETTFYDNEGGDGKAVDMYSYTTMIVGATKHLINKVETLEKENEELRNRLDKMEELLNGIINEG